MTTLRTLFYTTLLAGAALISLQAGAVDLPNPCQAVYEEIVPLRVPDFEQAAISKKTSGVKGIDKPKALLGVLDGGQIAIGMSVPYDEKTGLAAPKIQMFRTDKNGKVIVEKWLDSKDLKSVADAILLKDRVVVLTGTGKDESESITLKFLNGVAEEKSSAVIADKKLRLIPKSLMSVVGGDKMVIAAESVSRKNPGDSYTMLIWTDKAGKEVTRKEYLPGVVNRPEYIGRLSNGEMVVTGRVLAEDGREAGWVMRLDTKGEILFQRSYARGGDSVIRRAISSDGGDMMVIGDALPSVKGAKAAWVMRLNREGNPVWQKYLTGQYAYSGVDLVDMGDGRINAVLAAKPAEAGGRGYARIVTLSRDGVVIGDESFIEGSNAVPIRLINQKGKRYLLGLAETGFTKDKTPEELKYITYDSWFLAPAALPEFKNTCAAAPDRTLDDLP